MSEFQSINKCDISRLAIQKIISSPAATYLSKSMYEELNKLFLADNIGSRSINVSFRRKNTTAYGSGIAGFSLDWKDEPGEVQDENGNVWVFSHLKLVLELNSAYNLDLKEFNDRTQCIELIKELIDELSPFTQRFRVMTHNNEQRILRDAQRSREAQEALIVKIISTHDGGSLRRGLRIGGNARTVKREVFEGVDPGCHTVLIYTGSHRAPTVRKYTLNILSNLRFAQLRRIA